MKIRSEGLTLLGHKASHSQPPLLEPGRAHTRRPHMDAADETPRDCALSTTLQIRPNDFDRSFAVRYSAIADLVQDMR
jgi:hypothetical protein